MRVADLMSRAVQKVPPQAAAEEAWELMRLEGIHHLVVATGHASLVSFRPEMPADVRGLLSAATEPSPI